MNIEVIILKDLPKEQIAKFEDRVVYNMAVATREYTKSRGAYPYLTGKLMRSEASAPIVGGNKEYGLLAGVKYAKYVYKYNYAKWTNPRTIPHWYYGVVKQKGAQLTLNAVMKALKEIK